MTDARRGLATFTLLALLSLGLLALGRVPALAPLTDAVGRVAMPVQQGVTSLVAGARSLLPASGAESRRLRAEVDRLTAENVRLQQLEHENERLRTQLGFASEHPELLPQPARVIGRDPASIRQFLVIDRGGADGLRPGMAVTHPGGALIGQVLRVEKGRSEVLLVTDVESGVNAKVERTRADGIVEGRWQKGSLLEMRYIQQGPTADGVPRVQKGDWVVTSGLGGNLPEGLLVGRVDAVQQADTELEQRARVLPAVDVRSVETVLVVKGERR